MAESQEGGQPKQENTFKKIDLGSLKLPINKLPPKTVPDLGKPKSYIYPEKQRPEEDPQVTEERMRAAIEANHARQARILRENNYRVNGLHGTSWNNAERVIGDGFNESADYGITGVWFEEDTEREHVLEVSQQQRSDERGFAIMEAGLDHPRIDPMFRPFWVAGKDKVQLKSVAFYNREGDLVEQKIIEPESNA